jgi:ABC-type nitrate/sulfonate/bicarbonate transport system permease component
MKTKYVLSLILIFVVFALTWQFFEYLINIGRLKSGLTSLEAFLPTPITVFKTILDNFGLLTTELGYTLFRGIFGLIVGTILSFIMIVLIIFFPKSRNIFMPITVSLNSFPMIGFAPIIILIFGQGSALGIIFISAIISYFPTFVILDKATREVNEEFVNLAKIWGASKWSVFTKIQLPYILPYLFTSFKLALPASIIGATLGEWLGTRNGIGQLITISLYQLKPGMVYASLLMVVASVGILIAIINFIEKIIIPWKVENIENN